MTKSKDEVAQQLRDMLVRDYPVDTSIQSDVFTFLAQHGQGGYLSKLCMQVPEFQPYLVDMITDEEDLKYLIYWLAHNPDKCFVDLNDLFDRVWWGDTAFSLLRLFLNKRLPRNLSQDKLVDLQDRLVDCKAIKYPSKKYTKESIESNTYWISFPRWLPILRNTVVLFHRILEMFPHELRELFLEPFPGAPKFSEEEIALLRDYIHCLDLDASRLAVMVEIPGERENVLSRIHTARDLYFFLYDHDYDPLVQYFLECIDVFRTDILSEYAEDILDTLVDASANIDLELLIDCIITPELIGTWRVWYPEDDPIMELRERYVMSEDD